MGANEGFGTTAVDIFGATYVLRGVEDPAYLQRLAAEVDRRMRELASHGSTVDSGKLAILVAINLADELSRSVADSATQRDTIEAKVTALAEDLATALAES